MVLKTKSGVQIIIKLEIIFLIIMILLILVWVSNLSTIQGEAVKETKKTELSTKEKFDLTKEKFEIPKNLKVITKSVITGKSVIEDQR